MGELLTSPVVSALASVTFRDSSQSTRDMELRPVMSMMIWAGTSNGYRLLATLNVTMVETKVKMGMVSMFVLISVYKENRTGFRGGSRVCQGSNEPQTRSRKNSLSSRDGSVGFLM